MRNFERILYSDLDGGKAEIMKVYNGYRLTVWVNTWSIYYQKTFSTWKQARKQLSDMSENFKRVA